MSNADDDGDGDEYDGEQEVLADQRYDGRRRRDEVDEDEEEDGQADENRDGERDLVALEGDVEDECRQNGCPSIITSTVNRSACTV